ncbi:hypothetical protein BG015_008191 [Linnemannia schmuckeri]|uniref:Uncharacterized protein n=1 Tax=Linnemannia schmuckeri TaxID=64567 RepID=A0A9P5VAB1_9FUNG|nr:hypothetical protein BG015_008191 [Linnemannia schmuckeri]
MKFITSIAIATTAVAAVSAQTIAINDPNVGSIWKAGAENYLRWSGSCKTLGPRAKNVTVSLMKGPADRIGFVAKLGEIDCSSDNAVNAMMKVAADQAPGKYSLEIGTNPVSYSPIFDIINPSAVAPAPASQPDTPAPAQQQKDTSGAGALTAGSMVAAAGVAVAALQFIL